MKSKMLRRISVSANLLLLLVTEIWCMGLIVFGRALPAVISGILVVLSQQIGAFLYKPLGKEGKGIMVKLWRCERIVTSILPIYVLFVFMAVLPMWTLGPEDYIMFAIQLAIWLSRWITMKYRWEQ